MKTMRINPTISPHFAKSTSHPITAAGRTSFRCRASSTTATTPTSKSNSKINGTEKNKIHLANLENLLQVTEQQQKPSAVNTITENVSTGRSSGSTINKILEGINIKRIPWLQLGGQSVEESVVVPAESSMSTSHLNRLRQILSVSHESSPRNRISGQWRELHGSRDWAGLLDPLDENLRREIVRYGEFVQAAYQSFDMDPSAPSTTSNNNQSSPIDFTLPDKSYKVTKHLYATSSIKMPKWVDELAPDLGWMTQRSSKIGYVAVCDDRREIQRMGRRDIVISLRGTLTCLEWAENMRDLLVPLPTTTTTTDESPHQRGGGVHPRVECGFLSLFTSRGDHVSSLADSITEEIQRLIRVYNGETLSITIIGHSLGAALAVLAADHLANNTNLLLPLVTVFSFGGPRVGNRAFADRIQSSQRNVKVLRIVNAQDVVTRVPGMLVSEEMERVLRKNGGDGVARVLDTLDKCGPWAYAHVGEELRVETKMSPFLKPDADMACCHDLEAYLHLVDGFKGKNCPFRENAKRSLEKLLSEQGSNVKKMYMSKAKTMKMKSSGLSSSSSSTNFQTEGFSSSTSSTSTTPSSLSTSRPAPVQISSISSSNYNRTLT